MDFWWGIATGLLAGYAVVKIRYAVRDARDRRTRSEIDRIRGGYDRTMYIPNQAPPPSLRERILESYREWKTEWTQSVRTPEQVAETVYLSIVKDIYDKQTNRHQGPGVVHRPREAALRQS